MRKLPCISRLKTWLSTACLLLCSFCLPQVASATEFSWYINVYPKIYRDSSPIGAFNKYAAVQYAGTEVVVHSTTKISSTQFSVIFSNRSPGSSTWINQNVEIKVNREGDSCPDGYTYNSQTGICEPPQEDPCSPTLGQEVLHRHKVGDIITGGFSPSGPTPETVCSGSCRYISPAPVGDAYRFVNGNPEGAFQNYSYRGDGTTCQGSETAIESPSPSNKPTSESSNECTDKVTDAEGRVHYTCQTSAEFRDPGSMNCGSVNGKTVCVSKTPPPKLNKKESNTEVTETTNPDGSKTTTTTTTTTNTSCIGANACSTSTTTVTGSKGTNADGTPGGSSSTCVGDNCAQDGSGEEAEDDQEEECDPATDPDKCGQSSVTGETCDAPLACSGDAVQCAIMRKQKEQTCADKDFREIKENELRQELDQHFAQEQFQPLTVEADGVFDMSTMFDTSSTLGGGSCPVIQDLQFNYGDTVSVPLQQLSDMICPYYVWMGYLMVAFAMWRAAEIVAKGM